MILQNSILHSERIAKTGIFAILSVSVLIAGVFLMKQNPITSNLVQISSSATNSISEKIGQIFSPGNPNDNNVNMSAAVPISAYAGTPGVNGCGITLTIASPKDTIPSGSKATYTLTVKNEGTKNCASASVTAYYAGNQTYVSSTPKPRSSNYYWSLGNLATGASKVVSVTVDQTPGDTTPYFETEACATANNGKDACTALRVNIGTSQEEVVQIPVEVPTDSYDPGAREYGTWVWTSPYAMTAAYMDKVISAAAANNISVIYVTIDDYLAIHNLAEGADKESKKAKYDAALEKFIIAAKARGIAIDVEAGWRNWAESPNTDKATVIIDYAMNYNATHTNKIRGVQFDIEPYLLSTYEKNKAPLLTNFVALVDRAAEQTGSNSLRLSFVIPHFYDSAQAWTPAVTHDGITTYTFDHLLRILDARAGSSIILMSYRNFAQGNDGSIQISQKEVDGAAGHPTKVIVAQETGNVEPDYVTFYGTSRAEYEKQVALINAAFGAKSGFGGIAVHYLDPFLEL